MSKIFSHISLFLLLFLCITNLANAQIIPGELSDGFIRIAEPGQLVDTVNVWGDLGRTGRYIIPRGTTVTELISFGGGPSAVGVGLRGRENSFSKVKLRIHLSKFNEEQMREELKSFQLDFNDPIPFELRNYTLSNEEVIVVEIKRTPSFIDVLGVLGPFLGIVTTSIVIFDRL